MWVATFASTARLGAPCYVLVVAVGMDIQGAIYSAFDAFFEMFFSSQASSCYLLADILGAKSGGCVGLVWFEGRAPRCWIRM